MRGQSIPESVEAQVLFDAIHEPHEICKWDVRRKCDSYYIELYKQQQKRIEKTYNELITLIQIIGEQPSNNVNEDNYLLSRLESISNILKGDSNENR